MIKRLSLPFLLSLTVCAVAPGCSGSTSGGGGGDGTGGNGGTPVPFAEAETKVADAFCGLIKPCCDTEGFSYDAAKCRSGYSKVFQRVSAGVESGRLKYDAAAMGNCLAAIAKTSCNTPDEAAPAVCETVFQGTVSEGGACESSDECVGDLDCDETCKANTTPRGKAGDACSSSCDESPGGGVSCAGSGDPGAECFASDGLYCSADRKCTATAKAGEACEAFGCVPGQHCVEAECVPLPGAGEPCGNNYNRECADNAYCDAQGMCQARVAVGEACDEAAWGQCAGDAECIAGECRVSLASPALCAGGPS